MWCKRKLMNLSVKEAVCLSFLLVLLATTPAWGQYSSADCTGPQTLGTDSTPQCPTGTYPNCTQGILYTATLIPSGTWHTFLVESRPAGVLNDPHFHFTNYDLSLVGFMNFEGQLRLFNPTPDNTIYVFASAGLPGSTACDSCNQPLPMRGCPTAYGRFFDIDSDGDGVYDDMEVAFIDGTAVPLNFRILFVPLNWTGTQAQFDVAAQNQVNLFANSTTLGGCINTVEVVTLDVATQNFNTFTCNNTGCRIRSIRDFLRGNGMNVFGADLVVGLLPAGGSPCPPAVGCSNTIDTVWVEDDFNPILAHEIGHIYSLEDEYCSEQAGGHPYCAGTGDLNPLDAALNCNPNTGMGCCNCPNPSAPAGSAACGLACDPAGIDNYFNCCEGNDGALGGGSRCIMAAAGAGTGLQNWCQHCLDRLNGQTEFACDNLPSNPFRDVLAVELAISKDGKVQLHTVETGKGRPTRTDIPGSRFQVLLDAPSGNLLNESFDFLTREVKQEEMDFYYKVPVDFPIDAPPPIKLTVLDSGSISFRGTLYGTPPVANAGSDIVEECESPLGNNVTLDGSASSDADGDMLRFNWSVSGITFDDPTSETPTGQFPIGQTNVTLVVSDGVFDSSPDTVLVDIVDMTAPTITCPADRTIECDESTDPSNTGSATATDVCDLNPTITYSDMITPGTCSDEFVITRTWRATDAHGNYDNCIQTINVVDTTPPIIACNAAATIIPPDAPISFTATSTDNCDDNPSVEITGFDCFFVTKKGNRIDKTESCVVQVNGNTITITDSGGVDDHIIWTVQTNDNCGNSAQTECEVEVVKP